MTKQRINEPGAAAMNEETKGLLEAVKNKFGMVPNTFKVMANSNSVLKGLLMLDESMGAGKLPFETRNEISIAVSELNKCPYCLSAFTAIGKGAGVSEKELHSCRLAFSENPKIDSALKFAKKILEKRGGVSNDDVEMVRSAGYSDAEMLEIVGNVVLYTFFNYINLVASTEVDFPLVTPGK